MAERGGSKKEFFNEKLKQQLKKEIKEELLMELRGEKIEEVDEEQLDEKVENDDNNPKNYIKILIGLVLIVLVLDGIVLFYYYRTEVFNVSGFFTKNNISELNKGCSDGTLENTCSKTKPYFCVNGELVEAGYTCGCPGGYTREFQKCVKNS